MQKWLGYGVIWIGVLSFLLLNACDSVKKDSGNEFDYTESPVVIFNPDWTILPLPTNLMNPTFRQAVGVNVPGMKARNYPDYCTAAESDVLECMDLRAVIKKADLDSGKYDSYQFTSIAVLDDIINMGYDVEVDSDLTLYMKSTLNRLNGYYPEFIPDIPLSRKLDLNSIKPFGTGENDFSADEANFFFVDITNESEPKIISSDDYQLIFDLENRESFPYRLTIRNNSDIANSNFMPLPFEAGHIYLVVMTGVNDKGIKDTEGTPFMADSPFLLLASETPYVAEDGSSRNNLFTDINYVQEIEEARQTTDYGLKIWQEITENKRKRGEVVAAYSFSIASTPESVYMDPQQIVMSSNPLSPEGAVGKKYNKDNELVNTCTKTGKDFKPSFELSAEINTETVSADNVRLYKKLEDGSYEAVNIYVSAENKDGKALITIEPKAELDTKLTYLVAANNSIRNKTGNITNSNVYCSLVKSEFPVITNEKWNSPFLDSRPDIFVSLSGLPDTLIDKEEFESDPTAVTTEHLVRILTLIEGIRNDYQPDVEFLLTTDMASRREDILIMYTISPGGCPDDLPDIVEPDNYDDIILEDANLTGDFDLEGTFNNPLGDEDIVMMMFGEFSQSGTILDGDAVLSGTIYETDKRENGVKLDDAAVDKEGNFSLSITDFPISAELSDLLYEDAKADIIMEGKIHNSYRIRGTIISKLKGAVLGEGVPAFDIDLTGTFKATRRTESKEAGNE